jgi:hypothetical protein
MREIEKYLKEQEKRVEALANENRERMEFREKELGYIRELIKMVSGKTSETDACPKN